MDRVFEIQRADGNAVFASQAGAGDVVTPPAITGVAVSPAAVDLIGGATRQFAATVTANGNLALTVNWSATKGTINASGLFTAPAATSADQVIAVRATSTVDPTKWAEAVVTVAALAQAPGVTGVTITPAAPTVQGGAQIQLDATVEGTGEVSQVVSWATSLGTVTQGGLLTAPLAIFSSQRGTVTATSVQDPTKKGTASFTVESLATTDGFVPSAARTVRILAGRQVFDAGPFWTVNGTLGPVGSKDPNSTIDIPFDWSGWLADIGGPPLKAIDFLLSPGLVSPGAVAMRSEDGELIGAAVLVSEGTMNGGGSGSGIGALHTITSRITTDTEPPRIEDRTVVLQIKEQ